MDRFRDSDPANPVHALGQRELECLRAVAAHKRSAQIAYELNLKPKTVDAYVANACRKLGVADRASAARLLIEHEQAIGGKSPSGFSGVEPGAGPAAASGVSRLPLPWPTRGRPTNDLSFAQLLVAIGIAAAIMMAIAAVYLFSIALLSPDG